MYETFATRIQKTISDSYGSMNLMCSFLPALPDDALRDIRDIITRRSGSESRLSFPETDDIQLAVKNAYSFQYNSDFRWSLIKFTSFSLLLMNHLYFDGQVIADLSDSFSHHVSKPLLCSGAVVCIEKIGYKDVLKIAKLKSVSVSSLMTASVMYATNLTPAFLVNIPSVDCVNAFIPTFLQRTQGVKQIEKTLKKAKQNPLRDDMRLNMLAKFLPKMFFLTILRMKTEKKIVCLSIVPGYAHVPGIGAQTNEKFSFVNVVYKNGILSVYIPPIFASKHGLRADVVTMRIKQFLAKN